MRALASVVLVVVALGALACSIPVADEAAGIEEQTTQGPRTPKAPSGWVPEGDTNLPVADASEADHEAVVPIAASAEDSGASEPPVSDAGTSQPYDAGSTSTPARVAWSTVALGDAVGGGFTVTGLGTLTKHGSATYQYGFGCPVGGAPDKCDCGVDSFYVRPYCTKHASKSVDKVFRFAILGSANGLQMGCVENSECVALTVQPNGDFSMPFACSALGASEWGPVQSVGQQKVTVSDLGAVFGNHICSFQGSAGPISSARETQVVRVSGTFSGAPFSAPSPFPPVIGTPRAGKLSWSCDVSDVFSDADGCTQGGNACRSWKEAGTCDVSVVRDSASTISVVVDKATCVDGGASDFVCKTPGKLVSSAPYCVANPADTSCTSASASVAFSGTDFADDLANLAVAPRPWSMKTVPDSKVSPYACPLFNDAKGFDGGATPAVSVARLGSDRFAFQLSGGGLASSRGAYRGDCRWTVTD